MKKANIQQFLIETQANDPSFKMVAYADLKNNEALEVLAELVASQAHLEIEVRLFDAQIRYSFGNSSRRQHLYTNPSLMEAMHCYLTSGQCLDPQLPKTPCQDATERTLLGVINRVKSDGVLRFEPQETGAIYRGRYPFGVVEFGFLPYSKEQMVELLKSL